MSFGGIARKKTLVLPQGMLTAVKSFFKARTEREAVVRSLEEVLWRKKLAAFLDRRPRPDFALSQRELAKMRRE
ncbi:MAG: hypothetical protein HYV03_05910 [Deltaproteobacteria bacterium]|nr:hypothetical protein [Deltaproteobacteria bacterium]